jgi:hypothetical protein
MSRHPLSRRTIPDDGQAAADRDFQSSGRHQEKIKAPVISVIRINPMMDDRLFDLFIFPLSINRSEAAPRRYSSIRGMRIQWRPSALAPISKR